MFQLLFFSIKEKKGKEGVELCQEDPFPPLLSFSSFEAF